ncbi:response regulator transcription factor [Bifidobacterium sp. W8109]|uniref:response regulator transcription factor n=1 Tax=Bifidobacterium TaxID=1678 RepID=UPI0018DCCD1A|nr:MULTISPECIES: response regulator transcription factor [Bifidobacterium]MBH9971970.1 response regulator transcription factor [Bifidobacterium asteroides]MBH9984679.1 response regulator transcription factor [Bifidobacterium asteroides]MBI0073616.1 response regulator transcription factor [Bifidobacterium sp. W8110]
MIRVMIVDDQRPTRMGLALMVAKDPTLHVVAQAANGQDALDQLATAAENQQPLPDVILMDVRMPVMDGLDATSRIKKLHPEMSILILTTYDEDDYAFTALGAGASGFLLKDVKTADLNRAIHAVQAGDAILTPRITAEVIRRGVPKTRASDESKAREKFAQLGKRELEVASLVSQGLTNAEIAERLQLQPDSVKKTVSRILAKLKVRDRINIAVLWYQANLANH